MWLIYSEYTKMSKNQNDSITENVENMYKKYPYPSPSTEISQTNELLNFLRIFELESNLEFKEKNFLDAGSGSGHRINNVANFFKKCNFLGIDISETSLKIANDLKEIKKNQNINFVKHNIMDGVEDLGKFDIVLCMGVLHHLSDPKKGLQLLTKTLENDGMIFLYLYGKLGGHKRMLNKELVSILMNNDKSNYELGIKLVRELGLNKFEYGWNLNFKNHDEENALIVDSLLHANEFLYDCKDIDSLFKTTNLYGYAVFGITQEERGLIFDISTNPRKKLSIPQTNLSEFFTNDFLLSKFTSLSNHEKYRVIDLIYEPNGYTIIGFTESAYEKLDNDRLKNNFIKIK